MNHAVAIGAENVNVMDRRNADLAAGDRAFVMDLDVVLADISVDVREIETASLAGGSVMMLCRLHQVTARPVHKSCD
jgi:hypothetical protein